MYEMPTFEDILLLVSKTMLVPSSEHLEHFLLLWKRYGKMLLAMKVFMKCQIMEELGLVNLFCSLKVEGKKFVLQEF